MYDAKDKVVIVTGGASGIGAGVVTAFLEEGAKYVAIFDIDEKVGKAFENDLVAKFGPKARFIKCDVTTDLDAAYDQVIKEAGYIDVVVNNAGIMNDSPTTYVKQININVTALVTSSLKAYNLMRKDRGGKGGTIVNISSILALMQSPLLAIYSATKSAVLQFTLCLGADALYAKSGVRIFSICFGETDTALITRAKTGTFDATLDDTLMVGIRNFPKQKPESAVNGLIEAFKQASSASTWLVVEDKPAKDITNKITKAYDIMGEDFMHEIKLS